MYMIRTSFFRVSTLNVRCLASFLTTIHYKKSSGYCIRTEEHTMAALATQSTLETIQLQNTASQNLPVEDNTENYVRSVQGACFSRIDPLQLENPTLVTHSQQALDLLGLARSEVEKPDFVEYFCGNRLLSGSQPVAHCYCGHQFGYFSGQLGDGCAVLLGDVEGPNGERWELQFKGSGKTPYSRRADGRKVLRSSIREFLCSEAMHHLGIPTTRAGTCITSDNRIPRDIFYNGNVIYERATIITRIAPTFIRFGSFEIFKTRDGTTGRAGPSVGRIDILHQLLDYVTRTFFPEIHASHPEDRLARTSAFFKEVCLRTARLVAQWQCVGFCHGVLNTDNMSIVGVTIDYGPFGFMDRYDPGYVCNRSDDGGRYAYNRQPSICRWNLGKLAEALSPCLPDDKAKEGLEIYDAEFEKTYLEKTRQKLGLVQKQLPEDSDLVESLLDVMHKTGCDFTNGFQCLSRVKVTTRVTDSELDEVVEHFLDECATPQEMIRTSKSNMSAHQLQMFTTLMQQSPGVLLALGMTPDLIQSEIAKHENQQKLKNTSDEEKRAENRKTWLSWLKTYSTRLTQELDGSHGDIDKINDDRLQAMQKSNPKIILRNHIAQKAIEMAENGDYSEVNRVLKLLESPYHPALPPESDKSLDGAERECNTATASTINSNKTTEGESIRDDLTLNSYFSKPPEWALELCVT